MMLHHRESFVLSKLDTSLMFRLGETRALGKEQKRNWILIVDKFSQRLNDILGIFIVAACQEGKLAEDPGKAKDWDKAERLFHKRLGVLFKKLVLNINKQMSKHTPRRLNRSMMSQEMSQSTS